MADYLSTIAGQLGINLWLLIVIIFWSAVWKAIALWKSARNNHLIWFIILLLVNTVGILEVLYIYIFSKPTKKKPKKKKK